MSVGAKTNESSAAFTLKGRMQTLTVLRLNTLDMDELQRSLGEHIAQAPGLLKGVPLVIDCGDVAEKMPGIAELMNRLRDLELVPIAVQGARTDVADQAKKMGLAVLAEQKQTRAAPEVAGSASADMAVASESARKSTNESDLETSSEKAGSGDTTAAVAGDAAKCAPMTIHRPVRSGQQIYARGGDLVVLSSVSAGAEVIADGHVHVYGTLSGRAVAGAAGDANARVFCTNFNAELVSIAGRYKASEHYPAGATGRGVQVLLDGEQLHFKPLV